MQLNNTTINITEKDLFQNIDKLTTNFILEVNQISKGFDLREYSKTYPKPRTFLLSNNKADDCLKLNIDFINSALAHQITCLMKIDYLKNNLLNDICDQLYDIEKSNNVEIAKIKQHISQEKHNSKSLIGDIKKLETKKELITKLKTQAELQYVKTKANNLYGDLCLKYTKRDENNTKIFNFSSLEQEIKTKLKSNIVAQALNQELATYKLAMDYQSILDLCETDEQYKDCHLVKLFNFHIGDQLNKQLLEMKQKLNQELSLLKVKSGTLDHLVANISNLESNLISSFLVTCVKFFPNQVSAIKNNFKTLTDPSKRAKAIGAILASMTIAMTIGQINPAIYNLMGVSTSHQQVITKVYNMAVSKNIVGDLFKEGYNQYTKIITPEKIKQISESVESCLANSSVLLTKSPQIKKNINIQVER